MLLFIDENKYDDYYHYQQEEEEEEEENLRLETTYKVTTIT